MDHGQNGHSRQPIPPSGRAISEEDWNRLEPGDAIIFWLKGSRVVQCIYDCREEVSGQVTRWRWVFLDDGTMLEHSPDGEWFYTRHQIVRQGSPLYEDLLADDGALVRFEERVRAQTSGRQPVYVLLDGIRYRVTSTGTVGVELRGQPPDLFPWQSFAGEAGENVYFGLVNPDDDSQGVLGIWTGHVCLSFGEEMAATDIEGVYRQR